MSLEILFLGTGTSAGVPMIGCACPVCRSDDPRDHRSRPSVLISYPDLSPALPDAPGVEAGELQSDTTDKIGMLYRIETDAAARKPRRQYLVDTAQELRLQMIRQGIARIDGVLYTHAHADHIFGLDDLRRFNAVMKQPLNLYTEPATLERLKSVFGYIFEAKRNINQTFIATLLPHAVEPGVKFDLHGADWTPLRLLHGNLPILGYRVDWRCPQTGAAKSLAYCTDVSLIPAETYPLLAQLDVLVIDALRYHPHPTHLTVEQALQVIAAVKPGRAYFTHMAHDIRHAELEARLPAGVHLSYDGLRVEV